MPRSSIWPQISAAVSASLFLICNGFHYAWVPSFIPKVDDEDSDFSITPSQHSSIVLFLIIGGICGALLGLFLVNKWGRRRTLLLTTIPLTISCILIATARSGSLFGMARFLAGLGVGVTSVVTPMYIGEIAESRIRGSLCAVMSVMLLIGQLTSHAIRPWVENATVAILGAIIPIVFAAALFWAPESPYYYAMKEVPNETQKSVAWLRGTPDVDREVELIHNSMALNQRKGVSFKNLFTVSSNQKAIFVIIGLVSCKQLQYGSISFIDHLNFIDSFGNENYSYYMIITATSIELVASIHVVFLIDRVGRRPLLFASLLTCMFFLSVQALYSQLQVNGNKIAGIWLLPTVTLIGHSISYSIGLGTLSIVMSAELFPCEVKASALAISTVYQYTAGFGLQIFWQFIRSYYGNSVMLYFSVLCNTVFGIFMYFVIPETKGLSLSEIQTALRQPLKT